MLTCWQHTFYFVLLYLGLCWFKFKTHLLATWFHSKHLIQETSPFELLKLSVVDLTKLYKQINKKCKVNVKLQRHGHLIISLCILMQETRLKPVSRRDHGCRIDIRVIEKPCIHASCKMVCVNKVPPNKENASPKTARQGNTVYFSPLGASQVEAQCSKCTQWCVTRSVAEKCKIRPGKGQIKKERH